MGVEKDLQGAGNEVGCGESAGENEDNKGKRGNDEGNAEVTHGIRGGGVLEGESMAVVVWGKSEGGQRGQRRERHAKQSKQEAGGMPK